MRGFIRVARARRALQLRGEIAELGIGTESAREHLMSSLLSDIGATVGSFVLNSAYSLGHKAGMVAQTCVGFDATTRAVFEVLRIEGASFNPFTRALMSRVRGELTGQLVSATHEELVSKRDWESSAFINEYARPCGVDQYLGSVKWIGPTTVEALGLGRAVRDPPFS